MPTCTAQQFPLQPSHHAEHNLLHSSISSASGFAPAVHSQLTSILQHPIPAALLLDDRCSEDDLLAAALASKLKSMAPTLTSLYSDNLPRQAKDDAVDTTAYPVPCKQQSIEMNKQKRNRSQVGQHDSNLQYSGKGGCLDPRATDMHAQNTASARQSDLHSSTHISSAAVTPVQAQSQDCRQPRKRFRKLTGLEVLHQCMPSLWQDNNRLIA